MLASVSAHTPSLRTLELPWGTRMNRSSPARSVPAASYGLDGGSGKEDVIADRSDLPAGGAVAKQLRRLFLVFFFLLLLFVFVDQIAVFALFTSLVIILAVIIVVIVISVFGNEVQMHG